MLKKTIFIFWIVGALMHAIFACYYIITQEFRMIVPTLGKFAICTVTAVALYDEE